MKVHYWNDVQESMFTINDTILIELYENSEKMSTRNTHKSIKQNAIKYLMTFEMEQKKFLGIVL